MARIVVVEPTTSNVFRGLLGLSDQQWSLALQILGLAATLAIGMCIRRRSSRMVTACVGGLVVNIFAQIVVAGGGPGALVGFLFFPVAFGVLAEFGAATRRLVDRVASRQDTLR